MRIAVDVSVLDLRWPTGVQRGLLQLLHGLAGRAAAPEVHLVAPRRPRHLPALPGDRFRDAFLCGDRHPRLWRERRARSWVRQVGIALWHSPVQALPLRLACPRVATLHELSWLAAPDTRDEGCRLRRRLATLAMVRSADAILAVSRSSRDALLRLHPAAAGRCRVVPHGVDPRFLDARPDADGLKAKYRLPDPPWLLVVGRGLKRKGLPGAVRVLAALAADGGPWRLVLAGPETEASRAAQGLASSLGLGDRVHTPGWVEEEDLPALYASSAALLVPSLSEGFGLPVLEAMAAGLPVVASRADALREVAGDAACFADFTRPGEAAATVRHAAGTGREDLVARGRRRAASFSIEAWVQGHLDTWEEVLAG